MKRIRQYEVGKTIVDKIKIEDLSGYDVGKLLYASLWGMYGLSGFQRFKRILALAMCEPLHLNEYPDSKDGEDIAFEIQYFNPVDRADNRVIFDNIYEYLKPAKHVLLKKQYQFDLWGSARRMIRLMRYAKVIHGMALTERFYLAAQLVLVKGLTEFLDGSKFFQGYRYLLIFQEYDTISSAIIQNAKLYEVKVISPQHGMPMNRHENSDQLFFDGFLCDYKLVWNDFEKEQYLSAGIDSSRIVVVGNTKALQFSNQKSESKVETELVEEVDDTPKEYFGVLLDCPANDGAQEANRELLIAARKLAVAERLHYYVKPHPIDSMDMYRDILEPELALELQASMTIGEYGKRVCFSLAHVTGAIFDLISDECFVFQYITGESYPVDLDDIYRFTSSEELVSHVRVWKENYVQYRNQYKKTVVKYCIPNARERHDDFFRKLFAGELDAGEDGIVKRGNGV